MADEKAWCEFYEDINTLLENMLKGTSKRKLEAMGDLIYDLQGQVWSLGSTQGTSCTKPSMYQKTIAQLKKKKVMILEAQVQRCLC